MRAVCYAYLQEYRSPGHDDLVIRDCHDNDIYKLSGYKTLLRKYPYIYAFVFGAASQHLDGFLESNSRNCNVILAVTVASSDDLRNFEQS